MPWASLRRSLLAGSVALLVPAAAEAQVLRFTITAPGKVIGTGNTLGLSKELNANGPGIKDSIGTFLSLTNSVDDVPANAANPWPMGTTYDWTKNGSTAVLTLPGEGKVLYAELVWGGSYNYGGEDVTAFLDTPVTLGMGNSSMSVAPDPATSLTIAKVAAKGFAVNYYMRSADVTAFVKGAGSGTYFAGGVPATQSETINQLNAAGWTLAVVVHDTTEATRNLSVFVGGSFVDENSQQDYAIAGFCAPPAGDVSGHVVISAIEGDASLVGDQLLIAPTAADPFVGLSGPNNPANNFFCSQINDETGMVDMQGSFGTANADALGGVNISGGRQGWDVTTVPISSQAGQLQNGQTSAVLRTITTGDSYVPVLAALAIDVNAPSFAAGGSTLALSAPKVKLGDKLTATVDLNNSGQVPADAVVLTLALDPGLALTAFHMDGMNGDINGKAVDAAALKSGVDAGTLGAGQKRHVVIDLKVVAPPKGVKFLIDSVWAYTFQVCLGGATLSETFPQFAAAAFEAPMGTTATTATTGTGAATSTGSAAGGAGGDAAGGAGGGHGAGGSHGAGGGHGTGGAMTASGQAAGGSMTTGGAAVPGAKSGCGCTLPGDPALPWAPGALALAAAAALVRARRRARS